VSGICSSGSSGIGCQFQASCTDTAFPGEAAEAEPNYESWRIGNRILREVLRNEQATYGEQIVATLSRQLSWSHLKELLPLERPHQREFYAQRCHIEGWSVRTLRKRIESIFYDRTETLTRGSRAECRAYIWKAARTNPFGSIIRPVRALKNRMSQARIIEKPNFPQDIPGDGSEECHQLSCVILTSYRI
jgi:hypothetical protein